MKRAGVFIVLVCGLLLGSSSFADNHKNKTPEPRLDVDPKLGAALHAYERRDFKKALRLLIPVAMRGEVQAQFILGRLHALGLGTKKDTNEAEKWYRKAAEQGNPRAQYFLAINLFGKKGKNDLKAITLLRAAAKGGLAPAQFLLARKYAWGIGVNHSVSLSVYWHRKAAYQGYAPARMRLSDIYLVGARAKKDLILARMWTILARRSGHPAGGKSRANILRKIMTRKQFNEAKRLADLW